MDSIYFFFFVSESTIGNIQNLIAGGVVEVFEGLLICSQDSR